MRIISLIILLLCASCTYTEINDPKYSPSERETKMITDVLVDLEQRFLEIKVEVDFRRIPIFVVDDPTYLGLDIAGLCRGSGKRILLDRDLFHLNEEEDKIPLLWWTMLHEFGHCYFNRGHVDSYIYADDKNVFHIETEQEISDEFKYVCKLESSVMYPGINIGRSLIPIETKSYYILEMARSYIKTQTFENLSLKDFDFHIEKFEVEKKGYRIDDDCGPSKIDL